MTALRGTPHCGLGRAYTVTENTRWARDDVECILVEVLRLAFFFFLFFSVLEFQFFSNQLEFTSSCLCRDTRLLYLDLQLFLVSKAFFRAALVQESDLSFKGVSRSFLIVSRQVLIFFTSSRRIANVIIPFLVVEISAYYRIVYYSSRSSLVRRYIFLYSLVRSNIYISNVSRYITNNVTD